MLKVNTCLDKYGTTNIVNVPEIQEKIKQTNLEKYGNMIMKNMN